VKNKDIKSPHFILTNLRSLLPKIDELRLFANTLDPSFIFCTETWLYTNIPDVVLNIDGYQLTRKDRLNKRGGGLCIYSKTCHDIKPFTIQNIPTSCEHISFIHNSFIYVLLYLPPCTPVPDVNLCFHILICKLDEILVEFPSHKICIAGDFNRFKTTDLCNNLSIKNIVKDKTRLQAILDCCLLSKSEVDNFTVTVREPIAKSDHNTILCYKKEGENNVQHSKYFYDFRSSHLALFEKSVSEIDWSYLYNSCCVDEQCRYFTQSLQNCIEIIPKACIQYTKKDKKWITSLCKHLINQRWKAFRKKDYAKYNHFKEKVQVEIKRSKYIYYQKCKRSQGGLWQFVNKSFKKPSLDLLSIKNSNEPIENFTNRINEKLASNFSQCSATGISSSNFNVESIQISIHVVEVFNYVIKLKANKATGSDDLPNSLLKLVAPFISDPLTHIFNCSLNQQTFPKLWKVGDITPLPKSKPLTIEKIRPISLLPNVSKIFERIISNKIMPFILNTIHRHQFGFMPLSSTSSCLLHIQNSITNYLNSSNVIAVTIISFDLQKAFDCIPHHILLKKISSVLPKNICSIISSYLSNRYQQVKLLNTRSSQLHVSSGVPQGGILSPLLFNLFINDLSFGEDCDLYKYADDTTIVLPHYKNEVTENINSKMQIMEAWCNANNMRLNISKTQIQTIRNKRNIQLHEQQLDKIKILGVWFSSDQKWDYQIDTIIKKSSQRIHILRQLRTTLSKKDLVTLYKSTILSIVNYASALYVNLPKKLNSKLNGIGKRCHRVICDPSCRCLLTPEDERKKAALKLFKRGIAKSNHPLHSLIPHKLQRSQKLFQPYMRNETLKRSFIPTLTEIYNTLS